MNFGATGSIAYTSLSACFRSLLGMWVVYIMFTVRTCGGKPFCPLLFGGRGSSSSLCSPLSLFSAFNLPACLNTQQSLLVWLAGFSAVPCIWHERSSIRSRLDEPGLFLLDGFFRYPDLEPLNPALTVVSSVLSPLFRRLCLLRRGCRYCHERPRCQNVAWCCCELTSCPRLRKGGS